MKIGTIGKIAGGVVVLVVGVVVAGFAILANMDFNSYKPMITAEVKKATGRDLVIEGDLQLEIGFSPSIAVDGVRFQNAAWSEDANMVSVDRFEAKVNLLPLLSNTIDVERLILTGANIVLERNADGVFNFQFVEAVAEQPAASPAAPTDAGAGGGLSLPVVRLVEIRDSRVIYRDAVAGQNRDASIERLILAGEGVSDPLDLDFQGAVDGLEIAFGGKLGAPAEMLEPTRPWPIDLGGALAGATWALNGSIAEPTAARGLDLTFGMEGSQLGDLTQVASLAAPGASVPALGPYKVSATLTGNADGALALTGIAVSVGSPDIVQANVTGDIADLINAAGLDLAVAVVGESLANASEAAGTALPPIGPIEMAGTVTGSLAQQIVMEGFTAKIGGSDLAGTVRISTAGGKPYVAADLRSTLFDLADVAPPSEGGAASGGGSGGTTQASSAPSDGRAIPDMPLPVDGLKAADADVKLAVSTFKGPSGLTAEDIAITLALKNGDLRVDPIGLMIGGGTVAGSARLNAAAATPALTANLAIDKLDVGQLLTEMGVTDLIYGTINTDLSLTGAGGDLRGLLASLNGKSTVLMGEGRIKSEALDTWIGGATAVLAKLVAGNRPEYTVVNCFVNVIDFNGGVGTVSTGLFDIEYATITAAGDFNLGTEGLNLTIDPQPKSATINTAVPVKIGGTFLSPTYALDPAATARKAIGILGAIAFPPAAIVGLGELGTGDDNPCLTQGQGGGSAGGTQAPAQAAPAAPSNPVEAIQQGVGGALRGLLGGGN